MTRFERPDIGAISLRFCENYTDVIRARHDVGILLDYICDLEFFLHDQALLFENISGFKDEGSSSTSSTSR